jgi:hypothetical protein
MKSWASQPLMAGPRYPCVSIPTFSKLFLACCCLYTFPLFWFHGRVMQSCNCMHTLPCLHSAAKRSPCNSMCALLSAGISCTNSAAHKAGKGTRCGECHTNTCFRLPGSWLGITRALKALFLSQSGTEGLILEPMLS